MRSKPGFPVVTHPPSAIRRFEKVGMHLFFRHIAALSVCALTATACMDYGPADEETFTLRQRGLFILSEGNFTWDNASLSFYDPAARQVENEVFIRANGMKLGDVAQSMAIRGDRGYVVVNNSGVVYVIDTETFRLRGFIEGVVSPRYLHFPNDTTAYITDLYDARITVVDTRNNRIRGRIGMNNHRSTEQMAQWGDEVFVNCWSYDDKILIVDARHDRLVDSIRVGYQPSSLVIDCRGKLWVATDGRADEAPALYRIDAATRRIERTFLLPIGNRPSELVLDGTGEMLYFIARDVWRMPVTADALPEEPFLPYRETIYYGLTVDPATGEVYVADAIDYVQHGVVYRYTADGELLDTIRAGIIPGAFCFKP